MDRQAPKGYKMLVRWLRSGAVGVTDRYDYDVHTAREEEPERFRAVNADLLAALEEIANWHGQALVPALAMKGIAEAAIARARGDEYEDGPDDVPGPWPHRAKGDE